MRLTARASAVMVPGSLGPEPTVRLPSRMTKRARFKRLRPAERLLADGCRLYLTRPRGDPDEARLEDLARTLVAMNLTLVMDQWRLVGPGHLRPYWVQDVQVLSVAELPTSLHAAGIVRWSRASNGQELVREDRFRLQCPVPDRHKTDSRVRPTILLGELVAGTA